MTHLSKSRSHSPWRTAKGVLAAGALLATTTTLAVDIRISDLRDIDFGAIPPTAGSVLNRMDFCVAMSEAGRYSVIARGKGLADAFVLSNGFRHLPYTLHYSDKPKRRGKQLSPGLVATGFKGKKRDPGINCARPTASIQVTIQSADLEAASSGQYNGVLTLTVSPE